VRIAKEDAELLAPSRISVGRCAAPRRALRRQSRWHYRTMRGQKAVSLLSAHCPFKFARGRALQDGGQGWYPGAFASGGSTGREAQGRVRTVSLRIWNCRVLLWAESEKLGCRPGRPGVPLRGNCRVERKASVTPWRGARAGRARCGWTGWVARGLGLLVTGGILGWDASEPAASVWAGKRGL
jgi:hypothetical protein